ncbi:MAG: acyl-CoA thioesterase [Bradymonadia bacterium]
MTTPDLLTLTTPEQVDDHTWRWQVPDTWQQGRGAFGGLSIAALIRTMTGAVTTPGHALRTLTATLCGPVMVGPAELKVEILRAGSGTTTVACRLTQESELRSHAVGIFGRDRVSDGTWLEGSMPEVPSWKECERAPVGPPIAPVFTQHFDFWPLDGFPFSGGDRRASHGWVRPKQPGPARDAAYIAAMMDTWWPSWTVACTAPRPMGTISFTLEMLANFDGLDPDAPMMLEAKSPAADGGYAVEFRTLWGADGRCLAMNQQTFAIIK